MSFITMVILNDRKGSTGIKSLEVLKNLEKLGATHLINRTVIAQEGDLSSEGMRLAEIYQVDHFPFFLISDQLGEVKVYQAFTKFVQEALLPRYREVSASLRQGAA